MQKSATLRASLSGVNVVVFVWVNEILFFWIKRYDSIVGTRKLSGK